MSDLKVRDVITVTQVCPKCHQYGPIEIEADGSWEYYQHVGHGCRAAYKTGYGDDDVREGWLHEDAA